MLLFVRVISADDSMLIQIPGQLWIAEFVTVLIVLSSSDGARLKSIAPLVVSA